MSHHLHSSEGEFHLGCHDVSPYLVICSLFKDYRHFDNKLDRLQSPVSFFFFSFVISAFSSPGIRPGQCPVLNPTPVCGEITGCASDDECSLGQRCCLQKDCTQKCVKAETIPPPRKCQTFTQKNPNHKIFQTKVAY